MEKTLTMNAKWSSGIELGFEGVGVSSLATVDSVAEIAPSFEARTGHAKL